VTSCVSQRCLLSDEDIIAMEENKKFAYFSFPLTPSATSATHKRKKLYSMAIIKFNQGNAAREAESSTTNTIYNIIQFSSSIYMFGWLRG